MSMFGSKLQPSTTSRNLFGSSTSTGSRNPFGGSSGRSTNPFASSSGGNTSSSTTAATTSAPAAPTFINPASIDSKSVMYLSSNNPHRHSKLSTFPDNVKNGFYFIENKFENNARYMEAFKKIYSHEDMTELKEQTDEALKSVKSAWTSLDSVNSQLKSLQQELEKNKTVAEEIELALKNVKQSDERFDIPSTYFQDLITQFEIRLNNYQKRIDETDELINTSIEKETQKQALISKGVANDEYGFEAGIESDNTNLLYQVLTLLYQNFMTVANQVEAINEMVEVRVQKTKRFLDNTTNLSEYEINQMFEYKESESDIMINNLNSLSRKNNEKSTLRALNDLTIDDDMNMSRDKQSGFRKRKAYETALVTSKKGKFSEY